MFDNFLRPFVGLLTLVVGVVIVSVSVIMFGGGFTDTVAVTEHDHRDGHDHHADHERQQADERT